jgi:hypothetical protein
MLAKGAKLGRADLLRREAEVADLEDELDELKAKRPRCDKCGRLEVVAGGSSKLEDDIRMLKHTLREARQSFREARGSAVVVVEE